MTGAPPLAAIILEAAGGARRWGRRAHGALLLPVPGPLPAKPLRWLVAGAPLRSPQSGGSLVYEAGDYLYLAKVKGTGGAPVRVGGARGAGP